MNLKFKKGLIKIIFLFQKLLFYISKICTFWIPLKKNDDGLIIGRETANLLSAYSNLFQYFSINIDKNKFYKNNYSIDLSSYPKFIKHLILPLIYPIILRKFSSILFFSSGSFFISNDGREWEFCKAKESGTKIICIFVGSDIRSLKLTIEHNNSLGLDHWSNYINDDSTIEYSDEISKSLSNASNLYADIIFNSKKDQLSYIKNCFMPPMPVSRNRFLTNNKKWDDVSLIKILHSPSAPMNKGTQMVLSAIKKLEIDGFKFQFKLLSGVPQDQVLRELDAAHIALNEFYAYVPGIFGIEALESNCLLLTSASQNLEPDLFDGCDEAWVPTMYYEIYDNLRFCLENIHQSKRIANQGTKWAKKYCSHEATIEYFRSKTK